MYTIFTNIVNTLGTLGKNFSNNENVKKIIRSLSKEWTLKITTIEEAKNLNTFKITTIEEAKNLNTLTIDDLIGSLISYEEDLATERGDENKKKKSIALKVSRSESNDESEFKNEAMAMIATKLKTFFKKSSERWKFKNFKNQKEKKKGIICFECKKYEHLKS